MEKKMEKKVEKKVERQKSGKKLAIVLVRGQINVRKDMKDTMDILRLKRKNVCVVVEDTPANRGMAVKIKDYATWGEIDNETLKLLIEKRAEKNPDDPKRTKAFFRLNPPRKGFGRKGIKVSFSSSGALGYRGEKINDLIIRMI